jgi:hypothetical protein
LGRESTKEELKYLQDGGETFGGWVVVELIMWSIHIIVWIWICGCRHRNHFSSPSPTFRLSIRQLQSMSLTIAICWLSWLIPINAADIDQWPPSQARKSKIHRFRAVRKDVRIHNEYITPSDMPIITYSESHPKLSFDLPAAYIVYANLKLRSS